MEEIRKMSNNWRLEYEKLVLNGNIAAAKQIIRDNAAQINLLKFYRGTQRQLNTVKSGELWLSNAKLFNDPYDSLPLENMRSKPQYDRSNPDERKLAMEEYEKQMQSDTKAYGIQNSIFVCCFSEVDISNLHMWSYYADEHKGFCAEYSLKKLLDNGVEIFPVVYTKSWNANKDNLDFNTQVALIKSDEWKHEKEWRVVCISSNDCNKSGIKIPSVMPEAIYVGCRDMEHNADNWALHNELLRMFGDEQKVKNYVFSENISKISLDEILEQYEKCKTGKIPIFSMTLNESGFGVRKREVKY